MTKKTLLLLSACTLLAGCNSMKHGGNEEIVLSEAQQKSALPNAKPPQQFGFAVYPTGNGIAMRGEARLHPRHMATAKFESHEAPVIKVTGMATRMKMNVLLLQNLFCQYQQWR